MHIATYHVLHGADVEPVDLEFDAETRQYVAADSLCRAGVGDTPSAAIQDYHEARDDYARLGF